MLSLGGLAFASPWLLAGLLVLPAIWLLIRITPPAPKRVIFPAIQFLFGLKPREETPAHTPWWLLLLRLALAALLIIGLAHPLANPVARVPGNGALLIVIDDGWSSAHGWAARIQTAVQLTEQAEREVRPIMLQTTAPLPGGEAPAPPTLRRASDIRSLIQALQPKPWPVDRKAALAALAKIPLKAPIQCVYLADGLADPAAQKGATTQFTEALQNLGSLRVETVAAPDLPYLLMPPERVPGDVTLVVKRAATGAPAQIYLRAIANNGRLLARLPVNFEAGTVTANAVLSLPAELRNALIRIDIEAQSQAASTVLFDDRWQRRPVGVVTGGAQAKDPSLLDSDFYLERALGPYAELRRGPIPDLLKNPPTLLLMDDTVQPSADERSALTRFITQGGVLVRFAGEHLAAQRGDGANDDLLPVRLRGGRTLGSALQWSEPAHLAPFDATSPFSGLTVPEDVTISRQVLAEPSIDLAEKSWARLSDGTPLVTAEHRGKGVLALFHIPASAEWSNLPLSGLFVEMLRRSVLLGHGVEDAPGNIPQPAVETLDGFARLTAAAVTATPLAKGGTVDARHPPGYYGNDTQRRALNLTSLVTEIAPLGTLPSGVSVSQLGQTGETDLRPWFLGLALALLLIDLAVGLALRGLLPSRRAFAAGAVALIIGFGLAQPSGAQTAPPLAPPPPTGNPVVDFALKATLETRLAYIQTGVRDIDETSMAGLRGLTLVLNRRTAVEAAEPMAVDVEHDELAFFPLLYWPVSAQQPALSSAAIAKVNFYLRNGGTILFDTRGEESGADQSLQHLVRGLEIPPLMQVPPEHVLTRAFYLLHDFPGRYDGGRLWVEAHENPNDEVSSVILGSNDFAGAWATDNVGRASFAAVPGGENQREMAYRFGVNLVMYALTGNYKTDQVHVPAILERLGQ